MSQNLIDNILLLSKECDSKLQIKLNELIKIHHSQSQQIKTLKEENILTHKRDIRRDKMLEQQSKMAAMGEMMDAVAHQWKQPLNSISMLSDLLKNDFQDGEVDTKYIEEMTSTTHNQIEHMINTLQEFRTFFRPSQEEHQKFLLIDSISGVQILMKDELISHNISIDINIEENLKIDGLKNEFKHLFLNLISNSIDAFEELNIKSRNIYIRAYKKDTYTYIEVEDNAGGVPQSVIYDIFKPNVTTKKEAKGTGIGLYMSSQIVQKHHGKIEVHNSELGAFFTITLH